MRSRGGLERDIVITSGGCCRCLLSCRNLLVHDDSDGGRTITKRSERSSTTIIYRKVFLVILSKKSLNMTIPAKPSKNGTFPPHPFSIFTLLRSSEVFPYSKNFNPVLHTQFLKDSVLNKQRFPLASTRQPNRIDPPISVSFLGVDRRPLKLGVAGL
jgi:hypothetical protein